MSLQKDIYLIPDVKEISNEKIKNVYEALVHDESVLKRIIPQIFSLTMYKNIKSLYNFDSYIFASYRSNYNDSDIIDLLDNTGIRAITIPENKINQTFISNLKSRKIKVYTHTINNFKMILHYKNAGINGFYTDDISPNKFEKLNYQIG